MGVKLPHCGDFRRTSGNRPRTRLRLAERSVHGDADGTSARIVVLGDWSLIAERATMLHSSIRLRDWNPDSASEARTLDVLHLPLGALSVPGRLDPANSTYVLSLLDRALAGCQSGEFAAMVTAPVHKGVINDSGIPAFTGHTEYLAEKTTRPRLSRCLPAAI